MQDNVWVSRAVLVIAIAVGVLVALVGGTPDALPGVALSSELLLHLERGLVGFLGAFLVAVVAVRAARGHLPAELSQDGVKYATVEAARETRDEAWRPSVSSPRHRICWTSA